MYCMLHVASMLHNYICDQAWDKHSAVILTLNEVDENELLYYYLYIPGIDSLFSFGGNLATVNI